MINLIYLDYFSKTGDNGLNSYTYELTNSLKQYCYIKMT